MSEQSVEISAPAPDLDAMKRADLPVIWQGFREKIAALKATAESLAVTTEDDRAGMKLARQTRLNLREIRIAIESRRKELGEEALRRKQGIDATAKELRELIEPLETRMLEQEEFAARAVEARKAALASERAGLLRGIGADPSLYNLAEMPEAAFDATVAGILAANAAAKEAVRKAEAERVAKEQAEADERARVLAENERLRAEAAEREAAAKAEREAAAAALAKEREEAARLAAEAKAKADADAKKIREEAAERERIASEKALADAAKARKEREAVEAAARAEREAAEKENARLAGIAEAQRQETAKLTAKLAADKKEKDKADAARAAISADFETWWKNEGSALRPNKGEDAEEHTHRVAGIAWQNGAFKSALL